MKDIVEQKNNEKRNNRHIIVELNKFNLFTKASQFNTKLSGGDW